MSVPYSTEADLIVGLRKGDHDAIAAIVKAYGLPLLRHAASILDSSEKGEEVVQDVFLHLWESRENLQVNQDLSAYLYWLTKNRAIDVLRKEIASGKREAKWAQEGLAYEELNIAEEQIKWEEAREFILNAIAKMSLQSKEIFMLVWDRQLGYKEIASRFGISESSVRSQVSRAMKRIIEAQQKES